MAINNIINDQWQGHSHGEVEDALKALLSQMLQDIEVAGIPAGGVTAEMLAQSLQTLINGKYSKPGTGIPASDLEGNIPSSKLASAVQTSLGKADTALQSESDPVFAASAAHGITSTDINNWNNKANSTAIPTKTSDLTNDSGFVTDEDIEDFVTAESIEEIVMGSADVMVVETPRYIDIVFAEASITVKVGNDEVSGISLHTDGTAHESEQLSISGNHLKANIGAALYGAGASDYELSTDGTTYDSTALIAVTNEAVSNASLYVRYKGAKTAGTVSDATLTLTAGSFSKTISLHYSYASGPYISASPVTLTIKAATGQSNTGTLQVTGSQLTAGINATVSGTGFTVSNTENGTYGSQASLPSSGGTLYVKFSPTGSTGSTGTLTLTSDGAADKTVDLAGAVPSLSVSEDSLTLSTSVGVQTTDTFDVAGTALLDDVTLSVEGSLLQEQTVSFHGNNSGHYIKTNGSIGNGGGWYYSDYVELALFKETKALIKNGQVASIAFYDSSKTFIGYAQPTSNGDPITKAQLVSGNLIPAGSVYIRISNSSAYESLNAYVAYVATDASSDFSVSPASISEVDGEASGTVTVGFTPSAAGSYSGKVTVSSGSISKEVTISGTAS